MKTLFIIGNGFDIWHKLPTKYICLRNYLKKTYKNAEEFSKDPYFIPQPREGQHGEKIWNEDEVVGFLMHLIDMCEDSSIKEGKENNKEWGYFEQWLGEHLFETILDNEYIEPIDIDLDEIDPIEQAYDQEDLAILINELLLQVKKYFTDWVTKSLVNINYPGLKSEIDEVLKSKCEPIYLTFNYTRTLEDLYNCENVYHIHGSVSDKAEEIIFGHGDNEELDLKASYFPATEIFSESERALRKDTELIFRSRKDIFDKISNVEEIYSYGFSFSKVDMFYIEKIKSICPNAKWYLNNFDWRDNGNNHAKEKLEALGFDVVLEPRW